MNKNLETWRGRLAGKHLAVLKSQNDVFFVFCIIILKSIKVQISKCKKKMFITSNFSTLNNMLNL